MGKFDGILICTDLDGTLLKNDKSISKENLNAIEYFKSNGGIFSIMTGRMSFSLSTVLDKISVNAPLGFGNGGGLYDTKNNKLLYTVNLEDRDSALKIADYVLKNHPHMGIEIATHERIYTLQSSDMSMLHLQHDNLPLITTTVDEFSEPIAKILFADTKEYIDTLIEDLKNLKYTENFQMLRSDDVYYEVLPNKTSKGNLLIKLAEILNIDIKRTIALGDNDNDASMLDLAGIGIAVENASALAKESSDIITVSNEEHALSKLISDLDNNNITI